MTRIIQLALLSLIAAAGPVGAQADKWPAKPITYIVPFAAGGTTDVLARIIAQKLSVAVGQPVIVDNKPGARRQYRVRLRREGGPRRLYDSRRHDQLDAINPSLYPKMPYDAVKASCRSR